MVVSVPLCLALGVGGAWLVERTRLRGNRFWALALAAPLAIPAFVNSYGWVSAVPSLAGLWSGVLISVLSYFPLVYIPAAATLSRLDPSLEESAASLGLGPWQVFRRVVLPQLRLAMTGGALLVGLHLLAEYGAFAMIRFDTFTTAIMVQYQSTFNGAAGNMLASVLVVLCLLLLVAEVRSRGTARYARVGSGGQAAPGRMPLGRLHVPAQLALLLLVVLAVGVPMWFVAPVGGARRLGDLGARRARPGPAPDAALRRGRCGRDDARRLPDGLPRGAPTELVHPLARAVQLRHELDARHRRRPRLRHREHPVPAGVLPDGRSSSSPPTCCSSCPVPSSACARGSRRLRASSRRPPRRSVCAPSRAFVRVTLRLTAPAAAGGAALVFLAIVNELTATLLLAPNGTTTLATEFWAKSSEIDYAGAAPYALLMVVLSAPMTYLLFQQSKKAAGQ